MERIEVLLVEMNPRCGVEVEDADHQFARVDRSHVVRVTRVPVVGEKIRTKVQDVATEGRVNTAIFRVCEPPMHIDPSASMDGAVDWGVEAVCPVYRVTR